MRLGVFSLQLRAVEALIYRRFQRFSAAGPEEGVKEEVLLPALAIRLLRTILDKGVVGEEMLQQMVLADKKDVHGLLWKMVTDNLLTLQEVPKGQPNKITYMYSAVRKRPFRLQKLAPSALPHQIATRSLFTHAHKLTRFLSSSRTLIGFCAFSQSKLAAGFLTCGCGGALRLPGFVRRAPSMK